MATEPSTPSVAIARVPKRSANWPLMNWPIAYIRVSADRTMPKSASDQENSRCKEVPAAGMFTRQR